MMNVIWHGPVFSKAGYAEAARNYLTNLLDLEVNIQIRKTEGFEMRNSIPTPLYNRLMKACNNRINNSEAVFISHQIALGFKRQGRYSVGMTVWETTRIPSNWVAAMNRVNEIWTPSTFCKAIFENSGVQKPIHVIPHGVDPKKYNAQVPPLEIANKKGFNFLSIFDWTPRKNPEALLRAYFTAFTEKDDVALVIRVYGHPRLDGFIRGKVENIRIALGLESTPKIIWVGGFLHSDAMPRLYRACDAFVLPSRGEGWSLPCSEAMACGLPVIATKWSGNLMFMNESNSFLIKVKKMIPVNMPSCPHYSSSMRWADPDVEHLAELMRYVYDHPGEARERGARGMQLLHTRFTWRQAAEKMLGRLREV